jgi:hypothetical protein
VSRIGILQVFVLAGIAAILIYATSVALLPRRYGHIVVGDGIYYYVHLRSLVHDGDLDFTNEYDEFNQANTIDPTKLINTTIRTPTGLAYNMFAAGPALVAAPLYLVAHGVSLAGRGLGLDLPTDGYGLLYEGAFALTGVLASVVATACAYATARRLTAPGPSLAGVASVWLGGSLLYYTLASPVYAHSFSALGVAAWLLAWSSMRPGRRRAWFGVGVLGGLMAVMRWQEGLFALLPLAVWAWDALRGRWELAGHLAEAPAGAARAVHASFATSAGRPLLYAAGLAVGFTPQMIVWTVLFGAPLAVPQGGGFFTWDDPHWLDVLFSTRNGLFTWTPIALAGVVGLVALLWRHPRWAVVGLAALGLQVVINGVAFDWWGGAAFGARRFIGASPFLALGVAWLAALLWPSRRRLVLAVLALVVGLNGLLVAQYSAYLRGWTHIDTVPTIGQLTLERFTWPLTYLADRSGRRP